MMSEAISCLVIDDDPSARYIVRRLLAEPAFRLIEAGDGNEGIVLARAMQPDVILLDMMMPGMTGFEVADMLGQDGATRHIPVIAVTSKSLTTIELQHLALRSIPILSKQELAHERLIAHIFGALAQAGILLERK
jgi:CheY-like chemotaxis protein